MRTTVTLAAIATLALAASAFAPAESEVPEICTQGVPDLAEDEVLVEHTLYFHGEQPSGTPGQASNFPLGYDDEKTMSEDTPPEGNPKVDVLYGLGLNESFVGGPTLPYWRTFVWDEPRIVCAEAVYYGNTPGATDVRIFLDEAYGVGETDAVASVIQEEEGTPFSTYRANFGALDLQGFDLVVQVSHHNGLEPGDAVGAVAYDSTDTPSAFTYVAVEKAPATPGDEPAA